jgi:hypothetical protein
MAQLLKLEKKWQQAIKAELLAPVGWRLAVPELPCELEECILLAQGVPAAHLHHDTPLALRSIFV